MDLGIRGKTALVTGSSSGLGKAVAYGLAAEGVDVCLFARSADRLEANAAELRSRFGVRALAVAGDMRKPADLDALVVQLKAKGMLPDIFVLNTGRPPLTLREVLAEDEAGRWQDAYETQLRGAIDTAQRIVPLLIDKGWGRVIAITSASVKQPTPRKGLSTIFRVGLTAYLKHLANEIAATGVTVNSVCPANIDTPTFRSEFELQARKTRVPMQRLGSQEEFASAVCYLASQGAGFITGTTLVVDGGMTATLF